MPSNSILNAVELYDVLLQQWAPLAQAACVSVTSTGTPALNGTYAINDASVANIVALSTGIATQKPLPGDSSIFNYPDATNTMHAFTAANFLNFAAAIEDFVYNFEQGLPGLLQQQSCAVLPSTSLTIA